MITCRWLTLDIFQSHTWVALLASFRCTSDPFISSSTSELLCLVAYMSQYEVWGCVAVTNSCHLETSQAASNARTWPLPEQSQQNLATHTRIILALSPQPCHGFCQQLTEPHATRTYLCNKAFTSEQNLNRALRAPRASLKARKLFARPSL